eukprot:GHVP01035542.1.p1 GENE.GHVP01035542.1~~GHVP01035542.1.p1  ORF type:complete len:284 (+),score=49.85 GHVP01035542.1:123-974(+)
MKNVPVNTKLKNNYFWEQVTAGLVLVSVLGFCGLYSRPQLSVTHPAAASQSPIFPVCPDYEKNFLPKFHKDSLMEKIRKKFFVLTYLYEYDDDQDLFLLEDSEEKFLKANWEVAFTNESYVEVYNNKSRSKRVVLKGDEGWKINRRESERFQTIFLIEGFLTFVDWHYGCDPNTIKVTVSIPKVLNGYEEDIEKWLKMGEFTEKLKQGVNDVFGTSFEYHYPTVEFYGKEVEKKSAEVVEKSLDGGCNKDSVPEYFNLRVIQNPENENILTPGTVTNGINTFT